VHVLRDGADDVNFGLDITGVQVPIEGGEHVSIFTHRDEVRARVTRFLREHAPKPPTPLGWGNLTRIVMGDGP